MNFSRSKATLFVAMLLGGGALKVHATNYTYSDVLNLQNFIYSTPLYDEVELPSTPTFTLNVGDTISGTITFANNERLQVDNPTGSDETEMDLAFYSPGSALPIETSKLTLLGVEGSLAVSNPVTTSVNEDFYPLLEAVTGSSSSKLTDSIVSFSGFTYSITITGFNTPNTFEGEAPTTSHVFEPFSLDFDGPGTDVTVIPAPEPTTWSLFLAGSCLLGCFGKRLSVFTKSRRSLGRQFFGAV